MGRTVYTRQDFNASSGTTNSFTPPDNSLLVVVATQLKQDTNATAVQNATISGGGLTWTRQVYQGAAGYFMTGLVIWTAPVTTGASMTITVNANDGDVSQISIQPIAYTDYDSVGPVVSNTVDATDGAFSLTLGSAPGFHDEVVAAISATNATGGHVRVDPGSGWTEASDSGIAGLAEMQVQYRKGSTSTSVAWADVVAADSDDTRWNSSSSVNGMAAAIIIRMKGVKFANANSRLDGTDLAGGSGNLSVPPPTGLAAGDLWVVTCFADTDTGATITAPGGWTAVHAIVAGETGYPAQRSFWKIAGSSEGNASFSFTLTYQHWALSQRYTGTHQTSPIGNVATAAPTGSGAVNDAPNITIQGDGSMAVLVESHHSTSGSATTITNPAGTTNIEEKESGYAQGAVAYEPRSAGSYAPGDWDYASASKSNRAAVTFEILPGLSNLTAVNKDIAVTYNVVGRVSNDLAATYSVLDSTTPVNKDIAATYNVIGRVSKDLAATYNVLSSSVSLVKVLRGRSLGRGFSRGMR